MNDYYGAPNDFRGYLEHHGIKGQKWGVKNGPPYPLDASDHNARERKANWRSSLGSGDEIKKKKVTVKKADIFKRKKKVGGNGELHYTEHDTATDKKVKDDYNRMTDEEFKNKYKTAKATYAKRAERAERKGYSVYKNAKERSDKLKNSVAYKALSALTPKKIKSKVSKKIVDRKVNTISPQDVKVGMSDEMKDALTTLTVETLATTAAVATMVGLRKLQANAETDRDFLHYKNTAKAKTLDELPKTKSNTTTADRVKDNNPGYPERGRTMNCVLCTTSMALREKGYDVSARTSPDGWDTKRVLNKMFSDVKHHNVRSFNSSKSIQKAENLIKGFGNGAYGNICVYWPQGGGHSMFFKNEGGNVKIFDGQSGKVYSLKDFDQKILGSMYIARLDQAIPNNSATAFVEPRR